MVNEIEELFFDDNDIILNPIIEDIIKFAKELIDMKE